MAFIRGPSYRAYIVLENANSAINASSPTLSLATASFSSYGPNTTSANLGIGGLGSVTSPTNTVHEIKNLTGIEYVPGHVDDSFDVFGQTRPINNPIRDEWTLTLTRKAETKLFFKLFQSARFGATGSASPSLFDGLSTYPNETGFRLLIYNGVDWDVYYHGTILADGYKNTLAPSGITEEQVTFKGGYWKTGVTDSGELSAVRSIVQS